MMPRRPMREPRSPGRGSARPGPGENITPGHVRAFQMVTSRLYDDRIALWSCTVNDEPGVAIVLVDQITTPCGPAVWLLTELDDDGDTAFGLCDLGMGCPELGSVSLAEIETTCFRFGLSTEWDRSFTATAPLSVYAEAARRAGRIVDPLPSEGGGA